MICGDLGVRELLERLRDYELHLLILDPNRDPELRLDAWEELRRRDEQRSSRGG